MWRPDELGSEARRNLGPRHAMIGVLAALVLSAVLAFVVTQAQQALSQEAQRRAGGSLVWTVTADDGTILPGATCTRLELVPGVAAAGGIAATAPGPFYPYPGARPVQVVGVSANAVQVFHPAAPTATATLGADLQALGAVGLGSWLLDDLGRRAVALDALVPASVPIGALTSAITVPVAPDAALSQCWLRMEPGALDSGRDVAAFAFAGLPATITAFSPDPGDVLSPAEQWRAAVGLRPWAVGAIVLAAVSLVVTWSRRTELAVYRAFGTPTSALTALVAVELALVLAPAAATAVLATVTALALTTGGVTTPVLTAALAQTLAAGLTGYGTALALTPLALHGRVTDHLKDR